MPQITYHVLIAADVVGSTDAKKRYGDARANKMIGDALRAAREAFLMADPKLIASKRSAGDMFLLVGGEDYIAIYRTAVKHQSDFVSMPEERLAIKLVLGYGDFQTIIEDGVEEHRGTDLDYLFGVLELCPAGALMITPAMFGLLEKRYGNRLCEVKEMIRGFGLSVMYESDGRYQIPDGERQLEEDRSAPVPVAIAPTTERRGNGKHTTLIVLASMILIVALVLVVLLAVR